MKRSILNVIAAMALVMFGALTGYAQTSGGTMDSSSTSRDMATPSRSPDYSSTRMGGPMASSGWDMYRLSNLMGSDVKNARGETLGEVKDLSR